MSLSREISLTNNLNCEAVCDLYRAKPEASLLTFNEAETRARVSKLDLLFFKAKDENQVKAFINKST